MKSFPKRTILVLGFGLALGIQLVIGALSYRNTARLIATYDQVRHSQQVLSRVEDVLGDLTGDIAETHRKMVDLRKLTADNPEQQRSLDALEPKVKARLARMQRLIESYGGAPLDMAREIAKEAIGCPWCVVLADQHKEDLVEIRRLILEMEKEEQQLLSQRDEAARASARKTFISLFVGHAVSFALLFMVFNFLSREVTERQRAEQVSHGQTETLVKTLNALTAEPTLDIFSKQVLMAIAEQLGAHSASLWFCDRSRHVLWAHVLYERERFKPAVEFPQLKREYTVEEFLGWEEFVRGQRPVVVHDIETNRILAPIRDCLVGLDVKTMLCVPLITADDIIGCIALSNTQHRDYQPQELELVQALARQLSLAIQLTRLAEQGKQSAVLEERNRMARDIHDTLAQGFTGIIVQLEAAEDIFRENADGASAHILRAKSLARESLAEARRSVWALRPRVLEASDLAGALRHLANELIKGTRMEVKFSAWGAARRLPPETENNLLRIGQEALTNVLKHAQASMVGVELAFEEERVQLSIFDDGQGFDPEVKTTGRGFGLVSMRERARAIGGELTLLSRAGGGTQVLVAVPLAPQHSELVCQGLV